MLLTSDFSIGLAAAPVANFGIPGSWQPSKFEVIVSVPYRSMNEYFLLCDQAFGPGLFRERTLALDMEAQHPFGFREKRIRGIMLEQPSDPAMSG